MTSVAKTVRMYGATAEQFAAESADRSHMERLHAAFAVYARPGGLALDLGSGPGHDAAALAERGFEVAGCDPVIEFLSIAASRHDILAGRLIAADARVLPFRNEAVDGVWACASLLHLPRLDAEMSLRECFRVLKRDGVLFSSMQWGRMPEAVTTGPTDSIPGRTYYFYRPDEWLDRVERAGFELIEQRVARSTYVNGGAEGWIETFARKPA